MNGDFALTLHCVKDGEIELIANVKSLSYNIKLKGLAIKERNISLVKYRSLEECLSYLADFDQTAEFWGDCLYDGLGEPNGHLESDSEMNSQFFIYSSKEQEELIKNSKKCKRRFYSPPLNYSIYYDLAYDTVISDAAIRYKISHDIETGLIQCE